MVESVTFTKESYYYDTPKEQLSKWTRGMDRNEIISVTMHDDGSITLFYWNQ
ncbi:hypothetical protein P4571_08095 [Niallia alba]|uniref:hypothetical protein n=1 Tax=Niallia alba TaxID=2729105 RepID=UPI002E1F70FC|nr:hypothetical protein [Niallia alba]